MGHLGVPCSLRLAHLDEEISTLRRVALAHWDLDLAAEDALVLLDLTLGICWQRWERRSQFLVRLGDGRPKEDSQKGLQP
jgi:hypothetical protein